MTKLILDDKDLFLVQTLLQRWVPDALVMAYGSRVKGGCHEGSDLDLVIQNPVNPEQAIREMPSLKQAFSESDIPILVDVMDWAYLPKSYRDEINKINVIVQKPKTMD